MDEKKKYEFELVYVITMIFGMKIVVRYWMMILNPFIYGDLHVHLKRAKIRIFMILHEYSGF